MPFLQFRGWGMPQPGAKQEMIRKVTDAVLSVEAEGLRQMAAQDNQRSHLTG